MGETVPGYWKYIGGREVRQTFGDVLERPSRKYCSTASRTCWKIGDSVVSLKAFAEHLYNH